MKKLTWGELLISFLLSVVGTVIGAAFAPSPSPLGIAGAFGVLYIGTLALAVLLGGRR